ncbi:hypothetical protein E2562_023775 [Oryza meyeriana var. granulata]|uniref:Uncharacterized protein n=1 Tax=Oryza meyeriana var. granulata TaxID=110450 RepID=A0A6G1DM31_9ORYZ|nr:hypothetical protein E2562_023775 [Oryza meyeriana var. granulata]
MGQHAPKNTHESFHRLFSLAPPPSLQRLPIRPLLLLPGGGGGGAAAVKQMALQQLADLRQGHDAPGHGTLADRRQRGRPAPPSHPWQRRIGRRRPGLAQARRSQFRSTGS